MWTHNLPNAKGFKVICDHIFYRMLHNFKYMLYVNTYFTEYYLMLVTIDMWTHILQNVKGFKVICEHIIYRMQKDNFKYMLYVNTYFTE